MYNALDKWPVRHGIRIGYLNINNAINKKDDIASIINNSDNPFHLFCFSESRLNTNISDEEMVIPGYDIYRIDPHKTLRTGLLLYSASSLNISVQRHLEIYDVESIWLEIKVKGARPIIIGFIYRNPKETTEWIDKFNSIMDQITMLNLETIIFGDFNIDLMKPKLKWHNIYAMYNLEQLVDRPTRTTETSSTLIDHIYTNTKQNIIELCCVPCGCSDHNAICINWFKKKVKIPNVGHKTIFYRNFKKFNKDAFLTDLTNSDLDGIYQIRDPDIATDFWINTFTSIYNKHAPLIKKRVKHQTKPPWITKEIDIEINRRDHLKRTGNHAQFREQRNKVNSMKRKSKRIYFQNLLSTSKDSRQIWKAVNILCNKHASKSKQISSELSANELNNHFSNIANNIITNDQPSENTLSELKSYVNTKSVHYNACLQTMTVLEVSKSLYLIKTSHTRDLDGIDGNIVKIAAPAISETLTYLYNLCIDKQYFPLKFKQAKVIPLYKSGDSSNPSNYRPISILSTIAKPLEKHLHTCLCTYLFKNNLIHEDQSGFRKNHACHTTLIQLTDSLLTNINNNEFSGVIFIDFKKAFDVINHSLLLRKLDVFRLGTDFITLLSSFLSERKQLVSANNQMSQFSPIHCGIPQGSVLGPLLFSIYVTDLPCFVTGSCEMFADDTSIHSSDTRPEKLANKLQTIIQNVDDWTKLNHMSLNSQKTKCMYICARQKRQKMKSDFEPLFIGENRIDEVHSHKSLGVIIDRDLSWSEHVAFLIKRLSNKILLLSKIKNFLDFSSRKLFFNAHILPILDYASTLWDNCSVTNLNLLERMHKRALKLILMQSTTLTVNDYAKLKILPFRKRLLLNKALCMHNVIHGNAPSKITNSFRINEFRHTHSLILPRPHSNLYKSSFLYSGGSMWNNLPAALKHIKNKTVFKIKLKTHLLSN